MKLQDLFPGSFRASHFDEPKTLTIAGIVPIAFEEDGEDRQKGKMTFRETSNYWIFGKEAAGELADQIQDDETDNWVGHRITLRKDRTRFKGEMVDCIRGHFEAVARPVAIADARTPDFDLDELERMVAEKQAKAAAER